MGFHQASLESGYSVGNTVQMPTDASNSCYACFPGVSGVALANSYAAAARHGGWCCAQQINSSTCFV